MSCSNHHSNFSRKPRMSVRQVWKRKTSTPKSSPPSQNDSPPLPPRVYLQSPSPPSYNPLREQMINQLHNISTILDSHTNPSNAYIHAPPSPPPQQIHPPSHAQVEFHSSFCHWKLLEKFNMKDAEARCQPLGDHFKLIKKQAPKTEASKRRMAKVPYASAVGSMMYIMVLEGFSDSDYGGCLNSGKSTTGYVFTMGGTVVRWISRIQKCVTMSTTEAKYIAIAEAGKELVWLKNFLEELYRAQTECVLFSDNQSAIHLVKNPVFHGRMKHIKIRYHYIRELASEGTLSLKKILGAKNPANMLSKRERVLYVRRYMKRVSYVRRYRKVRAVALLKGRWFEVYRDYLRRRADQPPRAIYRTEVCTEVCAGAIYPNKVVSEPGYDKQWQKTIEDYLYQKKLHEPLAEAKPTSMKA
ncbi:hypothetical protein Tco_0467921 [Tanacetum coccineum]